MINTFSNMLIHCTEKDGGVHFNTIACDLTQPIGTHRKPYFCKRTLCMQGLKFSDLFCAFLSAVLGFSYAKNYG